MSDPERIRTISRFLRNQADLTDRPPVGRVELNNDEALLIADVLDDYYQQARALENPIWRWSALAEFYKRHAMVSKAMPMCFLCDGPPEGWPPDKQHAELPNVYVCEQCRNYRAEGAAHAREPKP